jgi:hypothetical protein
MRIAATAHAQASWYSTLQNQKKPMPTSGLCVRKGRMPLNGVYALENGATCKDERLCIGMAQVFSSANRCDDLELEQHVALDTSLPNQH